MSAHYGDLYKEIRINKGITQNEVTSENISRSTLSRIENNKIQPTVENFQFLLDQVDVPFEEFLFLSNDQQLTPRATLVHEFYTFTGNIPQATLENYLEKCRQYLIDKHDETIDHIYRLCQAIALFQAAPYDEVKSDIQKILAPSIKKLIKMEHWYFLELRFVGLLVAFLTSKDLVQLEPKIFKTITIYEKFFKDSAFIAGLLANATSTFLRDQHYPEAEKFLLRSLELAKSTKRYDFFSVAKIRLGMIHHDVASIDEGLSLLAMTHETFLLQDMMEDIKIHWPAYFTSH